MDQFKNKYSELQKLHRIFLNINMLTGKEDTNLARIADGILVNTNSDLIQDMSSKNGVFRPCLKWSIILKSGGTDAWREANLDANGRTNECG